MSSLNFDQYQFEGSRAFPVSAKTGISYEDYRSMQTATRGATPVAWVPPFSLNDKQLQKVLLLRVWRYIRGSRPMPETINREAINKAATAKALRGYEIGKLASAIQHEIVKKHRAAVRKAGGFLELHASIAFRSWRLGMDSVEVAASIGMTPQAVRQALWRMRAVAKQLGFDVGRAGHTAGKVRTPTPEMLRLREQAMALYKSGKKISEIETMLGYSRIRRILKAAGVYVPNRARKSANTCLKAKAKTAPRGGAAVVKSLSGRSAMMHRPIIQQNHFAIIQQDEKQRQSYLAGAVYPCSSIKARTER